MASTSQSETSESTTYQYNPLSSERQEFRVLLLLPGPPDAPLVGCIHTFSVFLFSLQFLDSADYFYDAMSYCWGAPTQSHSIQIASLAGSDDDDTLTIDTSTSLGQIAVTANVDAMLRSIRSETIHRRVWVDQICINQSDIDERSSQVKMMHRIYMNAKTTVVWLGDADEDTEIGLLAGLALAEMGDQKTEDLPERGDIIKEPRTRPAHWPDRAEGGKKWDEIETRVWQTFVTNILMRPWFDRTWVVQELALSGLPVVKIGDYMVSWDEVWTACDVIMRGEMHTTDPWRGPYVETAHKIGKMRLERIEMVEMWEKHPEWTAEKSEERVMMYSLDYLGCQGEAQGVARLTELQQNLSLASLLRATREAKATDPKDKVFALLNISTTGALDIIDYSHSLQEVYLEAAAEWESSHTIPEILDNVDTAATVNLSMDLPSWLPLWHVRSTTSLLSIGDAKACVGPEPLEAFPPKELWDKDIVPFMALGVHILTVKAVQEVMIRDVRSDWGSSEVVAEGRDHAAMISAFPDKYPLTGERYIDCYHKVIDPKAKDFECCLPPKTSFSAYKQAQLSDNGGHSALSSANYTEEDLVLSLPYEYHGNRFMMQGKPCTRRLFFTTTDGFMGLCSLGVQSGDKICVLYGGRLLYVLRETKYDGRTMKVTLHIFMGNCYVYGLMQGEALDWCNDENTEVFTLA